MIRVLIVDDQSLVRQVYRALLAKADVIQVIDEARDGVEALELVHRLNPDVILADVFPELPEAIRTVSQCWRYFSAPVSKLLGELHASTYHSFLEIQSDARASGC